MGDLEWNMKHINQLLFTPVLPIKPSISAPAGELVGLDQPHRNSWKPFDITGAKTFVELWRALSHRLRLGQRDWTPAGGLLPSPDTLTLTHTDFGPSLENVRLHIQANVSGVCVSSAGTWREHLLNNTQIKVLFILKDFLRFFPYVNATNLQKTV
jgi:hypothetical protein